MPYFDSHDGTRLHYQDWGTGQPVLFLAGGWLSSTSWELQMLPLSRQGLRTLSYDRRGHGKSDWVGHGYDYDTLSEDLAAFLEHLDLRDVVVVAHSMSGGELIRYLTRHGSERINRIMLVSCTLPFPAQTADNPDGVPKAIADAVNAARAADRPLWMEQNAQAFFATHLGNQVSSARIEWMIQKCMDCSLLAADEIMETIFTTDFRAELREITVPTMIIHGDADASANIDICGRKTKDLIPVNTYKEYPGTGHGIMITHAAQLNADILDFIKS
ncbi:alpha/beta fold hydrolase [Nocardia sp. NPDC059240]|uniref:alpha/beta fold hydrolase n=1 Tax=Nocardia sp. NPDC059240 TaxID=3346786 RepID=UPI0036B0C655